MAKRHKTTTIEEMKKERDELIIKQTDPERVKYLQAQIDYFEYGIKT